jgi:hypothetical protein
MEEIEHPLDDALDLPPEQRLPTVIVQPEAVGDDEDYEFSRSNMYELDGKISHSIEELRDIAYKSQHPRAYEVLANMYKTRLEVNRELMGIKKTKADMDGGTASGPKTINQTLVMTSEEVLTMLKSQN